MAEVIVVSNTYPDAHNFKVTDQFGKVDIFIADEWAGNQRTGYQFGLVIEGKQTKVAEFNNPVSCVLMHGPVELKYCVIGETLRGVPKVQSEPMTAEDAIEYCRMCNFDKPQSPRIIFYIKLFERYVRSERES